MLKFMQDGRAGRVIMRRKKKEEEEGRSTYLGRVESFDGRGDEHPYTLVKQPIRPPSLPEVLPRCACP